MGFLDKIKSLLGINKVKALPEGQKTQDNTKNNQPICLTRQDGSTIMITPVCDRTGNQCYQEVLDHYTGERRLIAQFSIADTALKKAMTNHGSSIAKVLMDIDIESLKNEEYRRQVANVLLSPNRVVDVVDNKEHYAGSVIQDRDGNFICTSSSGIVKGLAATRIENAQRLAEVRSAEEAKNVATMREDATHLTTYIKTSHAEELSNCPYEDAR